MKVSVIIPNYNHSKYLKQRIDSVLNQTFTDFELIILDDASTDCSREIIEDYTSLHPDILSYYNKNNSGSPFAQWDYGVRIAKGDYIWIAESDDFASEFFLERTTALLDENNSLGFVYCESKVL
jgi:glycosyltransferase involved in cell wall biosynthesis